LLTSSKTVVFIYFYEIIFVVAYCLRLLNACIRVENKA